MTATRTALRPYRWAELDALVEEELEIETRPGPTPAPRDPAIEEALFVEQAILFLADHPDPRAVLARIEALLPAHEEPAAAPEPEAPSEQPDEETPQ